MSITENQIKKIKEFALRFYNRLDFAHNVDHMQKTVVLAEFIAERENANLEIVRLGALLHQFHDDADQLAQFLEKIELNPDIIQKVMECVVFRPHVSPSEQEASIEAKVVYDADALQVLGPYGIIREVTCNIKARRKSPERSIRDARAVAERFFDSLQTDTARKLITRSHHLMQEFWADYDRWAADRY